MKKKWKVQERENRKGWEDRKMRLEEDREQAIAVRLSHNSSSRATGMGKY